MMTVPREEAERLAEIFREIVALSQTSRLNRSKTAAVDDSIKSSNIQSASETSQTKEEKPASDERSKAENR
jgi:hypothetical protein